MDHITEEDYYLGALQGSVSAFKELYNLYSDPLYRFIFRFTGSAENAEEILHDVFVELLSGKYRKEDHATLKNWLYTVAKNKCLNFRKKSQYVVADVYSIESARCIDELETQIISKDLEKILGVAVVSLPAELNKTWKLREQGMDYQEIAAELSIPVGTVKSRFHRIVQLLRKDFGKYET